MDTKANKDDTDQTIGPDYANLAINPYAISTDDLRMEELKPKSGGALDNNAFEGEHDTNQYEDTLEVAKKAGLTGAGRRKKENIIYEDATVNNNNKSKKKDKNKNTGPRLRNSALPPPPVSDNEWQGVSKKRSTQWKIPFIILLILVIIAIVGGAFGVLAYFDVDKSCSCTSGPSVGASTGGDSQSQQNAELISKLNEELEDLKKTLASLQTEQEVQASEQEKLDKIVQKINSTFTNELTTVSSTVSVLTNEVNELNHALRSVDNFTQDLSSTLDVFNSTFSIKLTNVSKQMGPRGYNGSQGIQGEPGIGNLSSCRVKEVMKEQSIAKTSPSDTKAEVKITETAGYKILGATCTTAEHYGAAQVALSTSEPDGGGAYPYTYKCVCVGTSEHGTLQPLIPQGDTKKYIRCIIKYWECPLLT